MSETIELYKRIMQRHALMADTLLELADLQVKQGEDINAMSRMLEQPVPVESEPVAIDPCANPTKRKFLKSYLVDELELPWSGRGVISDKIVDNGRWSLHHEFIFQVDDMPNGYAWKTMYSEGATEKQDERPWEYSDEVECTLVQLSSKTVPDWVPATWPEPASSTIPTEVRPPEMAVHAPSTVPPSKPIALCTNWGAVEWPAIEPGTTVRLDHGEFYLKTGFVILDCGSYCKIQIPGGPRTELGKRWLTIMPLPPENNELAAVVASTTPDHVHELGSCSTCDNPPPSEVRPAQPHPSEPSAIDQADPASRRRSRTDYTAAEWAHSPHFLAYVTRNKPFSDWSAERQNAKRDEFTATYKDAPPQNRWGKTFAKFCAETAVP